MEEKIWEVGQVFETLRQLFLVTLEHGTFLHFSYSWVNLHVSESHQFYVSSYSFNSLEESLWLSSHYVSIHASSSKCFQVTCHVAQCSREVSTSINIFSIIHFHTHVILSTFSLSYQITILISFVSLIRDTSWPSFDESVPVDINSLFGSHT
jgi:hypothetical protein